MPLLCVTLDLALRQKEGGAREEEKFYPSLRVSLKFIPS